MNAGELNKRIMIQRPVSVRAPSGQPVQEWVDVKKIWANIKCTAATTTEDSGAVQHKAVYKIYVRYAPWITAEMRAVYRSADGTERIYELTGPPADWKGNKDGMTLICKELMRP